MLAESRPRVVYVDEMAADLRAYSSCLRVGLRLDVDEQPPPTDLDVEAIVRGEPDAFLIDYQLTQHDLSTDRHATYLGGTLATRIRESLPEVPIILLTRKSLLRTYPQLNEFPLSLSQLGAVDFILYKDEVAEGPVRAVRCIEALIAGFRRLAGCTQKRWSDLMAALRAEESELDVLQDASPPLAKGSQSDSTNVWNVSSAARWILQTLFRFPGVLYDEVFAASCLGLSVDTFRREDVRAVFSEANFRGPFDDLQPMWWRGRLQRSGFKVLREAGLDLPLHQGVMRALGLRGLADLRPSICTYSGKPHADGVCYVLHEPVLREYSFEYFPDSRPAAMEVARASYKAALSDLRFDENLLSSEGRLLLSGLRREVESRIGPTTPPS